MEKDIESLRRQVDLLFELQRVNQKRIDVLSEAVENNLVNTIRDMKHSIRELNDKIR